MISYFRYFESPYQKFVLGMSSLVFGNTIRLIYGIDFLVVVFGGVGWLLMMQGVIQIRAHYKPFTGLHYGLFGLFLLLISIMIVRGYLIDYPFQWINNMGMINFHFFDRFYILPFILPAIVFVGVNNFEFKSLVEINKLFNVLFLIFFILTISKTLSLSSHFAIVGGGYEDYRTLYNIASKVSSLFVVTGFFLLCKNYVSLKIWYTNVFCWLLATFNVAIAGRRGTTAMLLLLGVSTVALYLKYNKGRQRIKSVLIVSFLMLFLAVFYFSSTNAFFSFINQRGFEDSRSQVDIALFSKLDGFDLCFGRGLNGRYYHNLNLRSDYLNGWRYGSETGFSTLVLKGGFLFALLYVYILLIPALKGIFKSKNNFTRALGIYILLSLIELYPFGWPEFNLKFLIIWIGASMCSYPHIRMMSDAEVKNIYFCNPSP